MFITNTSLTNTDVLSFTCSAITTFLFTYYHYTRKILSFFLKNIGKNSKFVTYVFLRIENIQKKMKKNILGVGHF